MDKRTGRKTVQARRPIVDVGLPSYSLAEAMDFVVKVKRANNLKEKTLNGYIRNFEYFMEWVAENYGELSANDVTVEILREYVLWCSTEKVYYEGHPFKSEFDKDRKGLQASSVNVRIRVLRTFFNILYKEEVINRNPAANLTLMRQEEDTVQPLADDELRRFLKAPDQQQWAQWRDYVAMVLILDCGMRLGELCSLEKEFLDLTRKQIKLPGSKTKNRKGRILPISTETARLLKQLVTETSREFDTPYVFTTNYGSQLSEKTVQKAFDKYAEKAKIGRSVSPHMLRHNFATMAAENGMPLFHLQKLMGHADIKTTRKYVQLSEESIVVEHRKFTPLTRLMKRR